MARKPRIEVEGGLYHIITRGNNRQLIFNSQHDYFKLLSLLETQKVKLPFFVYAYCLMPNHIHLLVERQEDSISRIMQRILTGYSQYHNRRYRRVGHLFQGRYKAILCQTDQYLAELVRYIHLNPVSLTTGLNLADNLPFGMLVRLQWMPAKPCIRGSLDGKMAIFTTQQ